MKKLLVFFLLISSYTLRSQVAINTTGATPHASSILDLSNSGGDPRGFLVPRLSLSQRNAIPTPLDGLLIYQTTDSPGFYYYEYGVWQKLPTAATSWNIEGNAGLGTSKFVGTTDNAALRFRQNNLTAGQVKDDQQNTFFGSRTPHNPGGSSNTAIGTGALQYLGAAFHNIAIGVGALGSLNSENANIAIGDSAMFGFTNSVAADGSNTVIGYNAYKIPTTGYGNTALGYRAMENAAGDRRHNTAIGNMAMKNGSGGDHNVAIGDEALLNVAGGNYNVSLGNSSGTGTITGDYNLFLGHNADAAASNLNMTAAIGYNAVAGDDSLMAFGTNNYKAYVFGRSAPSSSTIALQVGVLGAPTQRGNGAYLTNGGVWTNTSDVHAKEDFSEIEEAELLKKIAKLPVTRWRYKGSSEYHIGPMAQDFHALFRTGLDDRTISTIDPAGVALAAIKALIAQNEKLQQEIDDLKQLILGKK